jgi:hypothetical protein
MECCVARFRITLGGVESPKENKIRGAELRAISYMN